MNRSSYQTGKSFSAGASHPKPRLVSAVLILIFLFQFVMLGYFNFTQIRNHMGYDSSWNYLKSTLIWKEKALTSPNWYDDTNLQLDTHMLLVSLIYGLTGDIWLSQGIGNTLLVMLLLFFIWRILIRLRVGFNGRMIALNLVICPYLTNGFSVFNDLGYFNSILSGPSFYGLRILVVLMVFDLFLRIIQDGTVGGLACVVWFGCLLCGISSGVYLIISMLLPYLAYELEITVIRNEWKQLLRKESIFAYSCCIFVLAGKFLAQFLLGYEAIDNDATWMSLEGLGRSFGSVILGYMKLLQVLPVTGSTYHPIISVTGLLRMGALAVFILIVISVVFIFRQTMRSFTEKDRTYLFLINILLVNILILALENASYGAPIFEERYLIIPFFATILMVALFFHRLDPQRILSGILSLGMAAAILMVDIHSDVNYLKETNDAWPMQQIQTYAETQDAKIVYVWGNTLNVIGRSLRAWDLDRIYKLVMDGGGYFFHNWGDYLYLDTNEEYTGPTLLICPGEQHLVPENVLAEYTLLDDTLSYAVENEAGSLKVYVSEHNPKLW